jgi:hypothetical protein
MTSPSRRTRTLALLVTAAVTMITLTSTAATAGRPTHGAPDFGPNVTIFDPSMPVAEIQQTLDAAHARQVDNEMGTERHAYLFKPGSYGTAEQPLQAKVGTDPVSPYWPGIIETRELIISDSYPD